MSEAVKEEVESKTEESSRQYARYEDVDKEQLERDINEIKETMAAVSEADFQHLLKLERWGRMFTFGGYGLMAVMAIMGIMSGFGFWVLAVIAAILIGVGNVARWSDVVHPVLHGAYDKVPNIPERYTKKVFAKGARRYVDWLDWIKPQAWEYEHNIMHHYHLGEAEDPDNVEKNLQWLIQSKVPMWLRYVIIYAFAGTWKYTYYAPNTLRILENKKNRDQQKLEVTDFELDPRKKNGLELWMEYLLPYIVIKFVLFPVLFAVAFGSAAVGVNVLIVLLMAEYFANLHSFLVIVPNHSAEDIYMFNEPHKSTGEFYLRQIMGSVNYNTGSDFKDFVHGFLNYQIEHHLFPNMPHSYYQRMQPIVKEICKKHNLEYRQESVFKRIRMSIDLMVGKTKLLRVDGV